MRAWRGVVRGEGAAESRLAPRWRATSIAARPPGRREGGGEESPHHRPWASGRSRVIVTGASG